MPAEGENADRRNRFINFNSFFLLLVILHLVLISSLRLYPFTDLPNHLATATIFRFYADAGNRFSEYFSIHTFPVPNIFHVFFCSLKIFPSVEIANKVFYCLYVVLLPLSVLLVIRKIRGDVWFSLLSFLAIYNFNVSFGFVGYTISIPFVFLLFYFFLDLGSTSVRQRIIMVALFLLLFLMHAQSALFSLLVFFFCYLVRYGKNPLSGLKDAVVILPVVTIMFFWWVSKDPYEGPDVLSFLSRFYAGWSLEGMIPRLKELLYNENYHVLEGSTGWRIAYLFSFSIILPILYGIVRYWRTFLEELKRRSRALVLLLAIISSLCFFLLPDKIPGQYVIYQRFSVYFILSVIILGSVVPYKKLARTGRIGICVLYTAHFFLWTAYFTEFQRDNRLFTADVFTDGSGGHTLGGLVYDNQFKGRPIYIHFPNYHIVWNRGIASTSLVDYRFGCVRRKVDEKVLPKYFEWIATKGEYEGGFSNMDHIAVRGEIPASAAAYFSGFRLSKSVGAWSLYVNRHGDEPTRSESTP